MQQSRRLILVRHAKAEQSGTTDAERALAESGQHDAEAGGAWLAGAGYSPDHALVSSARRAQETWVALSGGGGWQVEADVSRLLYSGEPETVIDLIRELPDDARSVLVVGHNPTMAQLANLCDDGSGDDVAAIELTSGGFPTCSLAVFEYDGDWADLDVTSARLMAFHVGRA
ncbi:MAG: histidine phosphatase family protein [Nocardioides sp.]